MCCSTNIDYLNPAGLLIPPFVGDIYFCDPAIDKDSFACDFDAGVGFCTTDPLWDGTDCGSTSSCCEFHNPAGGDFR